jgi:hypothetical protein
MSELWASKAIERHTQLDLAVDQLLTSHDMLASVVGQDWLDEQAGIVQRSGSPFEASPL